jgi:hypothetical protein
MTKICLFQKFDEDHNVDIDELDIAVNAVATAVKVRRSHNHFTRVNNSCSKVTDKKYILLSGTQRQVYVTLKFVSETTFCKY